MSATEKTRPMASQIEAQKLPYPARQSDMRQQPQTGLERYAAAAKLAGKRALVTGGDSGIGRAVAIAFAKEGADVAIFFNENSDDAEETRRLVEANKGRRCIVIQGDVRDSAQCKAAVARTVEALGLDTYARPDDFYSYRRATHRAEPSYGRQLSLIALPARD